MTETTTYTSAPRATNNGIKLITVAEVPVAPPGRAVMFKPFTTCTVTGMATATNMIMPITAKIICVYCSLFMLCFHLGMLRLTVLPKYAIITRFKNKVYHNNQWGILILIEYAVLMEEQHAEARRLEDENNRINDDNRRLRQTIANSGMMPESDVELAKDLFTPEINAGKYGRYIAKNLGIGNYTEDEARVLLIYQSLIDTAVNEGLNHEPYDLAGFYEAKKMAYASVSTASKGGFLLTNLRTSRGISEITSQDNSQYPKGQQQPGGIAKLRPQNPQTPGYY